MGVTGFEEDSVSVIISSKVYHLQAIKKAAYHFTKNCFVYIEPVAPDSYRVRLKAKGNDPKVDIAILAGDFCNEVLDYSLRITIAEESELVRNLILANAFSQTSLIEPDLENADFRQDMHHIGTQDNLH